METHIFGRLTTPRLIGSGEEEEEDETWQRPRYWELNQDGGVSGSYLIQRKQEFCSRYLNEGAEILAVVEGAGKMG